MGIRVKTEGALPAAVTGLFALRGRDRRALAATLQRIAAVAPYLSDRELKDLGVQLRRDTAAAPVGPAGADGEIRVAMVARDPGQLAERAGLAADLTSAVRTGPVISSAGIHVSCGATGRVVLVFPGGTGTPAAEAATLARSVRALRWLDRLGVTAVAGVGHGLGEIAGLVWAGSLPATEAARLIAQHGELRRGAGAARAAMVRVGADEAVAAALSACCGLAIAAYEGPRSHVLAGPVAAVREVTRQAAAFGIATDVLDAGHALHTPAMAPLVAPLRSVLAQVRFGPPRRQLVSTVTARTLTAEDDIAALLCAQLTSPVRFSDALQIASADADLVFLVGHDESLAALAGASGFPAATVPADGADAACVAALFTAGALPDAAAVAPGQAETQATVQRRGRAATAGPRGPAAGTTGPPVPAAGTAVAAELAAGRGRFMETITVLRPGSELAAEARICLATDPYLADYVPDGRPVLPAAMGLEAMAQAASALARRPMRSARRVSFGDPIVIGEGGIALRVETRVRGDGMETILWAGSGGPMAECARAVFVGSGEPRQAAGSAVSPAAIAGCAPLPAVGTSGTSGGRITVASLGGPSSAVSAAGLTSRAGIAATSEIVDGTDLYATVCFQTGRFRRVAVVSRTPPRSGVAIVRGHDDAPWFGGLPQPPGTLILGSPGLNDAALQAVQACVPGCRLLPSGCDSLTVSGGEVDGAVGLQVFLISGPGAHGATRTAGADEYVWDVHGYDAAGNPVLAWIGLRVRDAGALPSTVPRLEAVTSPAPSRPVPTLRALA